jgi:hypothetical protein
MTPFAWVVLIVAALVLVWMGVVKWHDRRDGIEAAKRRHPSGRDL